MGVVKWAGIEAEARHLKNEQRRLFAAFVAQRQFVQDHLPAVYDEMQHCCKEHRALQSKDRSGIFNVVLVRCKQLPWCISCAQNAEWKRAQAAKRAFLRCTPEGEEVRFIRVVQGARFTDEGEGWGVAASQDIKALKRVVWETVKDSYPGKMGGVLTYQDFGERPFQKRNPHIDFTLNGWMLQDGEPVHTPLLDLESGGERKWQATKAKHAARVFGAAFTEADRRSPGRSFDIKRPRTGLGSLMGKRGVKYQVREMLDLRKMEYDRGRQVIYWKNYKENTSIKMGVFDFKAGVEEYRWRLHQWPEGIERGLDLTTNHGHMADRSISDSQTAFGGVDPKEHAEEWETGWLAA